VIRILVSALASPLAWGLLLMAAALALSFTERFGRAARRALVALVAVGWLLGTGPVADALIRPLERPYAVADPEALMAVSPAPEWVVVLAGSAYWHPHLPPGAWLHDTTLQRVLEGVRLHGLLPGSRLVLFTGTARDLPDGPGHSAYGRVAEMLGAAPEAMVQLPGALNTAGEARQAAELIPPGEPFYLVTCASHLTRALYLFRGHGLDPIPAPAHVFSWSRLEGEDPPPVHGPTMGGHANRGGANPGAADRGAANPGGANLGGGNRGGANRGAAKFGAANRGAANPGAANRGRTLRSFFPSAESYQKVERTAHEVVGARDTGKRPTNPCCRPRVRLAMRGVSTQPGISPTMPSDLGPRSNPATG